MNTGSSPSSDTNPLIIVAAGGTGGHVFPAIALGQELHRRGWRVAAITNDRAEEAFADGGIEEVLCVPAGGIMGYGILGKILSVFKLLMGCLRAFVYLKRKKPVLVVGFGGYASLPGVGAAVLAHVPLILHEQNAVLGRANRLCGRFAKVITTAFPTCAGIKGQSRQVHTGMPVRRSVRACIRSPWRALRQGEKFHILVTSGSQGAHVMSDVVPVALSALSPSIRERLHVVQQCRLEDLERVRTLYARSAINADCRSFIHDMETHLSQAHVVIARSGASTVAEVLLAGRPSILVPYPFAADNHQYANAQLVQNSGAGWFVSQEQFMPNTLQLRIMAMLNDMEMLSGVAERAVAMRITNAAELMVDVVLDVLTDSPSHTPKLERHAS